MSKKQWMVLLMLFLTYLLLGASIFYHIESRLEIERIRRAKQERVEINALLEQHYIPSHSHDQNEILGKLTRYCGKSVYNYSEGETDAIKWDFYNSFYFAYTVVSTIGYGNLAPTNMLSRILMIFYGLVGIPMNGILLGQLGEFFSHVFVRAHQKYKSYKDGDKAYYHGKLTSFETNKVGLAAQIFMYLTPGFVMFIFFPAFLFSHYEGWNYDEAVYYAFVTLTTIGFGDYVAGQDNSKGSGILFAFYKTFLICWISFGLGYIVMIMTFIARGMRSKKITRIEHKLAINLKHTQSKIWNEFNKEMNYLRRAFNELQLSKVKRVYVDECDYHVPAAMFPRSSSFPDLRELKYASGCAGTGGGLQRPRRRANSEVVPAEDQVARVVSETDLQRIDKTATFAAHAMVQPAELLARLVNILGYVPPPPLEDSDDAAVAAAAVANHDDTETEMELPQERGEKKTAAAGGTGASGRPPLDAARARILPLWRIGSERIPPFSKPRSRAASEVRLQEAKNNDDDETYTRNVEWTWSGPAASRKIQELMKAREAEFSVNGDSKTIGGKFRSFAFAKSMPKTLFPRWRRHTTVNRKSTGESGLSSSRREQPDRFATVEARNRYFERSAADRAAMGDETEDAGSGISVASSRFFAGPTSERRGSIPGKAYYTHTGASRPSFLERSADSSNLLEETSLADFLRAVAVLRARVESGPEVDARKPRRKMGTASLSPPKLPSIFTMFSSPHATGSTTGPWLSQEWKGRRTSVGARLENKSVGGKTSVPAYRRVVGEGGGGGGGAGNTTTAAASSSSSSSSIIRRGASRRFSLRPVVLPTGQFPGIPAPTGMEETTGYSSANESATEARQDVTRSVANTFVVESPTRSLIEMEGAPGTSSPMTQQPTAMARRRLSLRPPPYSGNLRTEGSGVVASQKITPRWKAGMLQRHIGQTNLRRRARAFSLSDVYTDRLKGGGGDGGKLSDEPKDSAVETRVFRHDPSVVPLTIEPSWNIAARSSIAGIAGAAKSVSIAMPAEESSSSDTRVTSSQDSRRPPLEWVDVFTVPVTEDEARHDQGWRYEGREEDKSNAPGTTKFVRLGRR